MAETGRNDCRRCFTATETVVIACGSNRATEKILIFIHTGNKGSQEQEEPGVLAGGLAGAEQISSRIRCQRPVVVLTGAIHTGKRFLMEQTHKIVLGSALFHDLHDQLVAVTGSVGIRIDGCQFMLTGRTFIVLCF